MEEKDIDSLVSMLPLADQFEARKRILRAIEDGITNIHFWSTGDMPILTELIGECHYKNPVGFTEVFGEKLPFYTELVFLNEYGSAYWEHEE